MLGVFHLLILASSCVLINGSVSVHNPHYCYSTDQIRPQLGMFTTHTAYETVRGRAIDPNVSSCTPSKFWFFVRHGTRTLRLDDLMTVFEHSERLQSEIVQNYESGRSTLCAADFELIRNWKLDPNITIEYADTLSVSGWIELQQLAERYQAAFPTALPSTYSRNDYLFLSSETERSQETLRAFANGLFGGHHQQVQFEQDDPFVRPYFQCPLLQDFWSSHNRIEQRAFVEGPEYQEMIVQVSNKLGFHGSHVLREAEMETLRILCRFEQIWDLNATSPFCSAFSIGNHQTLEYFVDLFYHYANGYGHTSYRRLRENMHCRIMQDMLSFLSSNDEKVRIFASHGPSLSLLLVALGAIEDEITFTRHNFAQQTFRLYRTSVVLPMAANLAVILHE